VPGSEVVPPERHRAAVRRPDAAPAAVGTALGVDIGGTKIAVALTRGAEILEHTVTPTPVDDLAALIEAVDGLVRPYLTRSLVAGVGVCAPGLVDPSTGLIGHCANVPAIIGAPLEGLLSERLGAPVRVENDANAAAWAEHRFGAAREWRASFFLTVSTGVGGGYVSEHGLHRGRRGYAADVGHITLVQDGRRCSCGERGCVEAYSSGKAIAERASEAYGRLVTTREAFELARGSDPVAAALLADAARALATALMTVTKVVDPDGLVIGGGVAANEPWFVDQVRAHLEASLLTYRPVPLEVAQLGDRAGVIGAASLSR
jgi:glucokinase